MKKWISLLLALLLLLSCFSISAVADEPKDDKVIYASSLTEFTKLSQEMKSISGADASGKGISQAEIASRRVILRTDGTVLDLSSFPVVKAVRDNENWYIIQFSSGDEAKEAAEKLSKLPGVLFAEQDRFANYLHEDDGKTTEKEKIVKLQDTIFQDAVEKDEEKDATASFLSWGADNIGADTLAAYLSKKGYTSTIKVAVLDTGVDSSHKFLKGRILSGYDFANGDSDPYDDDGHGTHVSGTIVDCTPGLKVKILPVKVLTPKGGYDSDIISGIRWAVKKGAKVINMSLGGSHSGNALDNAIRSAISSGVVVVVSSGNSSANLSNYCPAHIEEAITVGAVTSSEIRASFSNYGSGLDVVAPGYNIKSSIPGGGYTCYNGTSMAAPHVSALCAMIRLLHPDYSPATVQKFLKNNCRDLGSKGFDIYYGYGIPDMNLIFSSTPTLKLSKSSLSVKLGSSGSITTGCSGKVPSGSYLTVKSSNTKVATVTLNYNKKKTDNKITINGKKEGNATITVCLVSSSGKVLSSAKLTVKVYKKLTLTTNPSGTLTMKKGQTKRIYVSASTEVSGSSYWVSYYSYFVKVDWASVSGKHCVDITALNTGTTTLTFTLETSSKVLATVYLKVVIKTGSNQATNDITLNKDSLNLEILGKVKPMALLTAKASSSSAGISWKSSNTKVATVDENGIVQAVGEGTAKITATINDESGAGASCKVTVQKSDKNGVLINSYKLKKQISVLEVGKTFTLTPIYEPNTASCQKTIFLSSNPKIAAINQKGTITAKAAGKTTITCIAADGSGKKFSFTLKVKESSDAGNIPATELKLNKEKATLEIGKKIRLKAEILPENASSSEVKWVSSDESVATVSKTGLVEAIGEGKCTICCYTTDGSKLKTKCVITVK